MHIEIDASDLTKLQKKLSSLIDNDNWIRQAIAESCELMLKDLIESTPVDTGRLKEQWLKDNPKIVVRNTSDGWTVDLVNTTEYASWVEKGHFSYNQYGGPWPVKNAKVPDSSGWVYGRFFVRKTENIWQNGKLDANLSSRLNEWLTKTLSD